MAENKREDLLSSWKEIAAYLGCDKRTCLRWEKLHGLPIRRLAGTSKSRVHAFRDELDQWLSERSSNHGFQVKKTSLPRSAAGTRRRNIILEVAAALGLLAAVVVLFVLPHRGFPADFQISGSRLRILDAKGRFLWEFDTGLEGLLPEADYRLHFQTRKITGPEPSRARPWLMFRDLEGDGSPEVLFAPKSHVELGEGRLICFSADGRVRWTTRMGRVIRYGGRVFPSEFVTDGFDVFDVDADGRQEIVATAHAFQEFPTQVGLLDADGRLRGEYWSAGQITDVAFFDLDGDARPEILLVGIANEYERGMLIVLDPRTMLGGSPQRAADYISPDLGRGTEKAFVLLALSELDALFNPGVGAKTIDVLEGGIIEIAYGPSHLIFQLDRGLKLVYPRLSHTFERLYKQMLAEGRIKTPYDPERIAAGIHRDMRYWDGENWTPTPAFSGN